MIDIILDTLIDGLKLFPFLLITYLIMEYLEHKTEKKTKKIVENAGKLGPLYGSALGIFPQCGFSAAAASLYSGRVITLGTLIAVFLSTSDEMLPIFISEVAPVGLIIKVLLTKLIFGIVLGFTIDILFKLLKKDKKEKTENKKESIHHLCKDEHCNCEHDGIFKSAIKHTLSIFLFILLITFVLNCLIDFIGEEAISNIIQKVPVLGVAICCLIGLIPNCASSVVITELYLSNLISYGSMIAGLLVGSGVGILVLFRSNKNLKENMNITLLLYFIGLVSGIMINIISQ